MQRWSARASIFSPGSRRLALGLGLIGIGKPWGFRDDEVPPEAQARELLETAIELGVRFFDTAPSYGVSESRFGAFLQTLAPAARDGLTLATKFGEHWDAERGKPFVDHSYDALARSLDGSLAALGRIDFLQLHKTSPEALASGDVERAFRYAQSLGIRNVGASVSDLVSAEIALRSELFSVVQCPLNPESLQYQQIVAEASAAGLLVLTNRPFGMGRLLYEGSLLTPRAAFGFLAAQRFDGVVLTGTKAPAHLRENWAAFQHALASASAGVQSLP